MDSLKATLSRFFNSSGLGVSLGAVGYFSFFGLAPLNPAYLDWLMTGDTGQSQLTWMFFSQSPWTFPLGRIQGLVWPFETSLVSGDGLPLFALVFKLLLSKQASLNFQFFGFWLLFCFLAQGFFAGRLVNRFVPAGASRFFATALLALAPVLPFRQGHLALCGHWVILGVLDCLLQTQAQRFRWRSAALFCCAATAIHAYLAAMSLGLVLVVYLGFLWSGRKERAARLRALRAIAAVLASFGLSFWAMGYLGVEGASDPQPFYYHADLLQFFNSNRLSAFIPRVRTQFRSYEAFAYLGLAPGLLFLYLLFRWKRFAVELGKRPDRQALGWTFLACLLMGLYALSPKIHFGGNPILSLAAFYRPIEPLVLTFRATGRFIWPWYYFCLLLAISSPVYFFVPRKAAILLGAVLLVQVLEIGPWWISPHLVQSDWDYLRESTFLPQRDWKKVDLVAPYLPLQGRECSSEKRPEMDWYIAAAVFAVRRGIGINSGSIGRFSDEKALAYCSDQLERWGRGELERDTLYFLHPGISHSLHEVFQSKTVCRPMKGTEICWMKVGGG